MRWGRRSSAVALAAFAMSCSCSVHSPRSEQAPLRTASPERSAVAPSTSEPAGKTVWLCRPGASPDPCASSLTSTAVLPDGSRHGEPTPAPRSSKLDCFYVYPTVSQEPTANADLTIQPAEINVAIAQAARFSDVCRV